MAHLCSAGHLCLAASHSLLSSFLPHLDTALHSQAKIPVIPLPPKSKQGENQNLTICPRKTTRSCSRLCRATHPPRAPSPALGGCPAGRQPLWERLACACTGATHITNCRSKTEYIQGINCMENYPGY